MMFVVSRKTSKGNQEPIKRIEGNTNYKRNGLCSLLQLPSDVVKETTCLITRLWWKVWP
jgi:hypothetical protein